MSTAPNKTHFLRDADLRTIAEIGHMRKPREACGILLTDGHRGERVFEMPNRATSADTEFLMVGEDILMVLEGYGGGVENMTVWHTHPGGQYSPSKADMAMGKPEHFAYLIVVLYDDPRDAKALFY